MLNNAVMAKSIPKITLGTSIYDENQSSKYMILGSPAFEKMPSRVSGVFGGFLFHFSTEIQSNLLWCGRSKNISSEPLCKSEFSFEEKEFSGIHGFFLVATRNSGYSFYPDFKQKAVYLVENTISVGYGLLDDIVIYDVNDPYYQDIVALPQIEFAKLNASSINGRVLFYGYQSQNIKEVYGIYYPKLTKESKDNHKMVKAVILMQAFYPISMERQLLEELFPELENNLTIYSKQNNQP